MAFDLDCLGMGAFNQTEDFSSLVNHLLKAGRAIPGYNGHTYINQYYGDALLIACMEKRPSDEKASLIDLFTASRTNTTWKVFGRTELPTNEETHADTRILASAGDEESFLVINLVNAQVLPGYFYGEPLTLKMTAFATDVSYFENEERYAAYINTLPSNHQFDLSMGSLLPSGLLHNRTKSEEDALDDLNKEERMLLCAQVKDVKDGILDFDGSPINGFIRCTVSTKYGDLEVIHNASLLTDEEKANMKEGSVLFATVSLTGDCAVGEYSDGRILDDRHHLKLLRNGLITGKLAGLREVIAKDAVFSIDSDSEPAVGSAAVFRQIASIQKAYNGALFLYEGVLLPEDDSLSNVEPAAFSAILGNIGKPALLMALNEPDSYVGFLMLTLDEKNMITGIELADGDGLAFYQV